MSRIEFFLSRPGTLVNLGLRLLAILFVALSVLTGVATAQQARIVSVQALPNTCAEMPDVLSEAVTEFASFSAPTRLVSQAILTRLSTVGMERIEAFFRCFNFREGRLTKRDEGRDIVREIFVDIPLARVRFTKDPNAEIMEQVVYVSFSVQQKKDGTIVAWGFYNNG